MLHCPKTFLAQMFRVWMTRSSVHSTFLQRKVTLITTKLSEARLVRRQFQNARGSFLLFRLHSWSMLITFPTVAVVQKWFLSVRATTGDQNTNQLGFFNSFTIIMKRWYTKPPPISTKPTKWRSVYRRSQKRKKQITSIFMTAVISYVVG